MQGASRRLRRIGGLLAGAALGATPLASAGDGVFSVSIGFDYSSGKYGDVQSTEMLYVPVIGKYRSGPWLFKLTVPYLQIDGPGNVLPDIGVIAGGGVARTRESGLGDVVAAATFDVYEKSGTLIGLTGKVKFGTADESKGLGTGENDYYLQVDWERAAGKLIPFVTLGYRVTGDPADRELYDVFYGSVGGIYVLSAPTRVGLAVDLRERSSAEGDPKGEASLFVSHRLDRTWKLQGYATRGFTDGSPSWALGGSIGYVF